MNENQTQPVANKPQSRVPAIALIGAAVAIAVAGFCVFKLDELNTKLAGKDRQLAEANLQISTITKDRDTLTQALAEGKEKLAKAEAQLSEAMVKIAAMEPLAAKAKEMPVAVSFRKAVMGEGFVLCMQNRSTKTLALNLTITDASNTKTNSRRVVLDGGLESGGRMVGPGGMKEIGHLEGWAFASGDSVQIECAGFDPITKKVK